MSDSDNSQTGAPLFEGFPNSGISPPPSGKRKREDEPIRESKQASKRKKTKIRGNVDDENLDNEPGVNHALAYMDSRLVADHIAQRTKRFRPEMSLVEADDCHIPERAIIDTTSWQKPRIAGGLPAFLEYFAGPRRRHKGETLLDAAAEPGSPHTLVIASAGLRAADLTRALRKFRTKNAMVAKLFAKHIKLNDAVEMLKQTRTNIGVGTPQRVLDLLDSGALSTSHLERIVIDASHIDQKKRGILDMKETQIALVQLLSMAEMKSRYGNSDDRVELIFF